MKRLTLTLSSLFLILTTAISQDGYIAKPDSIQSDILKQNRKLIIFLPEGYDSPDARFPVLYVLDADGRCQHTATTARFLFVNNKMPKSIIVGVFNIDRNHDFLPDSSRNATTGGGADNFTSFFDQELVPYIDKNFKTEPYKVLIGHSYGGVFAMHVLLNKPDLFDGYIAIDPSFWYKNQMQVKQAGLELMKNKNWKQLLFIAGREGGGMKDMGITAMEKQLKAVAPQAVSWKVVAYENEDHGSVPFKSVYDGLRYIFDTGGNFKVYPESGILPKGKTTWALIQNLNPNLRYTTDGSEPTSSSPLCPEKIKISVPCTLKVKSVSNKYNAQPSVSRIFSEGEFLSGQESIENMKPGLKYSYYEGVWDSIPDFSELKPVMSGFTDDLNLKFATRKDSFAVQFEGYLHITKEDLYDIWITSDDGSQLFFDNKLLLNNDGLHSDDSPAVKLLPLKPGYYPIMIRYFEKTGDESVSMGALVLDKKTKPNPTPIPKEMFFHKE